VTWLYRERPVNTNKKRKRIFFISTVSFLYQHPFKKDDKAKVFIYFKIKLNLRIAGWLGFS
jgi:hypothetical protein